MPGTLQDYAQAVHDVISSCRDAEQGFRGAAQAVNDPAMKEMFEQYSAQRAQFAAELQGAVKALGFEATDPQGLGGMLHASWISLKGISPDTTFTRFWWKPSEARIGPSRPIARRLEMTLPPEIALDYSETV